MFEIYVSAAGLAMSIIGSAIGVGMQLGQIKTRLAAIDKHLDRGAERMDHLAERIEYHEGRLVRLETRAEN